MKKIPFKKYTLLSDYHWRNDSYMGEEDHFFDTAEEALKMAQKRVEDNEERVVVVSEALYVVEKEPIPRQTMTREV